MVNYTLKWKTFVYQKTPQRESKDMLHTARHICKTLSSEEFTSKTCFWKKHLP